jgi:hypothetical protein
MHLTLNNPAINNNFKKDGRNNKNKDVCRLIRLAVNKDVCRLIRLVVLLLFLDLILL